MFSGISKAERIDVLTYIPKQAPPILKIASDEQKKYFPELPTPWYLGGLAEQESCISLTHSKCFNAKSKLMSNRELGGGIFQLTKAYRADGSIRFDSLEGMKKQHEDELEDLNWDTIWVRPDLQIRAGILMTRDNYRALYKINSPYERLNMTDSAYNCGMGCVNKARVECGLRKGCDPQVWFGNVEKIQTLSLKPIYGTQSPYSINRLHVYNVRMIRMEKYKPYFVQ